MLANLLIAAASVSFFLARRNVFSCSKSLRPHQTEDVSDVRHVLPFHVSARCETNKRGNGPVLISLAHARTNAPAGAVAFINYEHAMSWSIKT